MSSPPGGRARPDEPVPLPARRHAVGFSASLRQAVDMDELAVEVSSALGVSLRPEKRGPAADHVGEMAGLTLWLTVVEPDPHVYGPPQRIVLVAGPESDAPDDAEPSVDISLYIAELLRSHSGRPWQV